MLKSVTVGRKWHHFLREKKSKLKKKIILILSKNVTVGKKIGQKGQNYKAKFKKK